MRYIRKLPDVEGLYKELSLTSQEKKERLNRIAEIQQVLSGHDKRKLIIIGPCSADREDAVIEYVLRLARLSGKISDQFIIIPRVYTSKPRTTGEGYKGMLHNPYGNSDEDLWEGIITARKLHLKVVRETGLYSADEMLYPDEIYYMSDILCYLAVGARSVEDQGHRMLASDDSIPVGLKNPTGGSKIALVNSIRAAQASHRLIYRGWEVETAGNSFAHGILRGFTNKSGQNHPNYHYEDIVELHDMCYKSQLKNPGVIIDCNHANSNKRFDEQPRISREVIRLCKENSSIDQFIKGLMIESYIEDGAQKIGNGIFGKSITDPCLGWEKTEKLLLELASI